MHCVTTAKIEVSVTLVQALIASPGTESVVDHFSRDLAFFGHGRFYAEEVVRVDRRN